MLSEHLTELGLAYWIMCDSSLQKEKSCLIIHTQSFTEDENRIAVEEINQKWGLECQVIPHRRNHWVIKSHPKDKAILHHLLKPYLIDSMQPVHTCTRAHVHTEGVQRCATECNGVHRLHQIQVASSSHTYTHTASRVKHIV